jgi:endo-alpha-1,4-polygalactosaminidase (GH114 family)
MIGRRGFTLGMASLLASGTALADDKPAMMPKPKKKRRADIPFTPLDKIPNHRQFMRDIVIALSEYAKKRNPKCVILARNAPGLIVKEMREWKWETLRDPDNTDKYPKVGAINRPYLKALDGILVDGFTFGVPDYGKPTDADTAAAVKAAVAAIKDDGKPLLTIDYCSTKTAVAEAEAKARKAHALAYIDRDGDKLLGRIPTELPMHENPSAITDILKARNYLPLLRSDVYGSRIDWVDALAATNYDVLMIDTFWRQMESITFSQMKRLKYKRIGTDRLVFGVLPLAIARDTRFYWKPDWKLGAPSFLVAQNPADPAETIVNYWDTKWKELIGQYIQGIVDLGVDGILLDQLDAYLYFEDLMPLE